MVRMAFMIGVIVVLFILINQVLKGLSWSGSGSDRKPAPGRGGSEDLVRDPYSGVYFPKSQGVASLVNGRILYFVNVDSRDKYLKERKKSENGGTR